MIVGDVRVEQTEAGVAFRAIARPERRGSEPVELRHGFAGTPPGWVVPGADPLIAALLIPTIALGEDLRIDAEASPKLLARVSRIVELTRAWKDTYHSWRDAFTAIPIEAAVHAPAGNDGERPPAVGLFFSAGVDSFHSLLRPAPDVPIPTHLLAVRSWRQRTDGGPGDAGIEVIAHVARETGLGLVVATTNIRDVTEAFAPWSLTHGSALASLALALGGGLGRAVISATYSRAQLHPWGSHPMLDPLWSTGTTEIVHGEVETSRTDRIWSTIAGSSLALENLLVCSREAVPNCGTCGKCVSTMLALHAVGALQRCPRFAAPVDAETVRATRFYPPHRAVAERVYRTLRSRPSERPLVNAIRVALDRSPPEPHWRRVRAAPGRRYR